MVTVVVPALILWSGDGGDVDLVPALFGAVLIALGLALVVWTVELFVTVGQGTLAPGIRRPSSSFMARTATFGIR